MEISNQGPSCEVDKSCCGDEQVEAKLNEPSCTLSPSEAPERLARWQRLFAGRLGHDVGKTEAEFRFTNTRYIKSELKELIKLEQICCAGVSWHVSVKKNEILLTLIAEAGSIRPLVNGFLPLLDKEDSDKILEPVSA